MFFELFLHFSQFFFFFKFYKTQFSKFFSQRLFLINFSFFQTIFEMNKSTKSQALAVMQAKRKAHEPRILVVSEEKKKQKAEKLAEGESMEKEETQTEAVDEKELAEVFGTVIGATKHQETSEEKPGKKKKVGGAGKKIDRAEQMKMERVSLF